MIRHSAAFIRPIGQFSQDVYNIPLSENRTLARFGRKKTTQENPRIPG